MTYKHSFPLITLVALSALTIKESHAAEELKNIASMPPSSKPTKVVSLSDAGGIQSLCSATKDDHEIILIGHARVNTWSMGPYSLADNEARKLMLPYLDALRESKEPIIFLSLDSAATCQEQADTLKKSPTDKPNFHAPLQRLINTVAHEHAHALGNLHIRTLPEGACFESTSWNPAHLFGPELFPGLAECSQVAFNEQSQTPLSDLAQIERILVDFPLAHQKAFFSKEGKFRRFIGIAQKLLREQSSLLTIEEYYQRITAMATHAKQLSEQKENPLQELALMVKDRLEHTHDNVDSYLAAFGCTDNNMSLFEVLCTIIKTKRSMTSAAGDFSSELITPIWAYQALVTLHTLISEATTHKRVVSLIPYTHMVTFCQALKKAGFSVNVKGYLPSISLDDYAASTSPFTDEEVHEFLSTRFGFAQKKTALSLESPFYQFVNRTGNPLTDKLEHLAMQTKAQQQKPLHPLSTESLFTCLQCTHKTVQELVYVSYRKKRTALCSMRCLTDFLITQKASKLREFLAQRSDQDTPVLEHMAALCYVRFLSLCPSSVINEETGHILKSGQWISLLRTLEKTGAQDPTWHKALSLLKPLAVQPTHLISFLELYQSLKETYAKKAKGFMLSKKKSSYPSQIQEPPIFDEKGRLVDYLTAEYTALAKAFSSPTNPHTYYPRMYYLLAQLLSPNGTFSPTSLEKALNLRFAEPTIDALLEGINKK